MNTKEIRPLDVISFGGEMKRSDQSKIAVSYWVIPGGGADRAYVQVVYFEEAAQAEKFCQHFKDSPSMPCLANQNSTGRAITAALADS